MNSSEFMDLSLQQWGEIFSSHLVSDEGMMEFLADIIEKEDARESLDLSLQQWEEISSSHPVSDEGMMEFLEDIIEKANTRASLSRKTKYLCEHCAKEFTIKSNLQRHLKIHAQKKEFNCGTCTRLFYRKDKLQQHEIVCRRKVNDDLNTTPKKFVCTHCQKDFKRNFDLQRHEKIHARKKEFHCSFCSKTFYTSDKKKEHESECTRQEAVREQVESSENQTGGGSTTSENNEEDCQTALDGNLKSIQMKPRENEKYDLSVFLQGKRANALKHLEKQLKEKKGIKWFISVQVEMVKYNTDLEDTFAEPHFRSNCQRLLHLKDLPEQYLNCVDKIKESFETYQREGSGWQLKQVRKFVLNFSFCLCVIFYCSLKYAVPARLVV